MGQPTMLVIDDIDLTKMLSDLREQAVDLSIVAAATSDETEEDRKNERAQREHLLEQRRARDREILRRYGSRRA